MHPIYQSFSQRIYTGDWSHMPQTALHTHANIHACSSKITKWFHECSFLQIRISSNWFWVYLVFIEHSHACIEVDFLGVIFFLPGIFFVVLRRGNSHRVFPVEGKVLDIFLVEGVSGVFEDTWIILPNRKLVPHREGGCVRSYQLPGLIAHNNYFILLVI